MGCDIHDFAEVRHQDGSWRRARDAFENPYYKPDRPEGERNRRFCSSPCGNRNYCLFAILADVRNGIGFAGCDTSDRFNVIAEPRGLPEDVCREILEAYCLRVGDKEEDEDAISLETAQRYVDQGYSEWLEQGKLVSHPDWHSASWLLLRELEEFDWGQTNTLRGWVDASEFEEFKKKGAPSSYCGGISGGQIQHISNEEMEDRIRAGTAEHCYTKVAWKVSYAHAVDSFLTKTVPALRRLGSSEDVRIVFWFDN